MLELYNDKLIDLFAKPGTSDDVSLLRHFLKIELVICKQERHRSDSQAPGTVCLQTCGLYITS